MTLIMREEIVRHFGDVQVIRDICGELRVLTSRDDFEPASLVVATISGPSIPHYHQCITEFYFVWEGAGIIVVGRYHHEVTAGTTIIIPPNRAHYTIPREIMKVLAFSVPGWFAGDQVGIGKDNEFVAHYSKVTEKCLLIEELLIRSGKGFTDKMDPVERESLEEERQSLVLKMSWNKMSIPELRELLILDAS